MKLLVAPASRPFKRLLLFAVISLVLLVAQFFMWSWVRSLAQQWKQDRSQEQQVTELTKRLASIKSNYAQQQPNFNQLSILVPPDTQTPQLVGQLEKLAESNAVQEVTQTIDEATTGDPRALTVTLQANGQAASLLRYVKAVEQLPELVDISSWSLDLGASSIKGQYSLTMTVVFFLQT